ncbi:hypothetical protein FB561_1621 [Kribbella amoyensis]|uniref:YCII-related domain-containing protein n=1 Tax=Kribbella amoyensis TaxID=996641 RepID=A0A561BNT4_9ACTN|nr:YciI family protein [Kribbella amoyensis]TWD80540.1 hypothetical protein FB561_1621 [Kribbella amoyensis]
MRYLMMFKASDEYEAGEMPGEDSIEKMTTVMAEMAERGVLLAGDGLAPSSQGFRLQSQGGKPRVIDGPFAETKELVAGFALIQVASREEAEEWARRCFEADSGNSSGLELRRIFDADDFGDEFTPQARERSETFREVAEGNLKKD